MVASCTILGRKSVAVGRRGRDVEIGGLGNWDAGVVLLRCAGWRIGEREGFGMAIGEEVCRRDWV